MEGDSEQDLRFLSSSCISIHSLRMEGDNNRSALFGADPDFNPLPPHGGRRPRCESSGQTRYFNPLPPHGGRLTQRQQKYVFANISIHSLRMEGDLIDRLRPIIFSISIHSLRMEGDPDSETQFSTGTPFQSTPSAWRETNSSSCSIRRQFISIHSLRMEGDQSILLRITSSGSFQSTPSAWRETEQFQKN